MLSEAKYINAIRNRPDVIGAFCDRHMDDPLRQALEAELIPPPTPEQAGGELAEMRARLMDLVACGAVTAEKLIEEAAGIAAAAQPQG
jgi:hypothetical protein